MGELIAVLSGKGGTGKTSVCAAVAVTAMWDHGIGLDAMSELTRGEAAKLLYRVSKLAPEAPGLMIYR